MECDVCTHFNKFDLNRSLYQVFEQVRIQQYKKDEEERFLKFKKSILDEMKKFY
jgi:hypothetical protein